MQCASIDISLRIHDDKSNYQCCLSVSFRLMDMLESKKMQCKVIIKTFFIALSNVSNVDI